MFHAVRGLVPALLIATLMIGAKRPVHSEEQPASDDSSSSDSAAAAKPADDSDAKPAASDDEKSSDENPAAPAKKAGADKKIEKPSSASKTADDEKATGKDENKDDDKAEAHDKAGDNKGDADKSDEEKADKSDDSKPAPGTMAPQKKPAQPKEKSADEDSEQPQEKVPAANRKSIAVIPYGPVNGEAPQSSGDKVAELFRDEITKAGDFKLVEIGADADKSSDKKPGEAEMAAAKTQLTDALAQLDKVKSLLERRKVKPAADAAGKGIAAFVHSFQGADDFKALSDAYARLAVIRFMQGNDDACNHALDDLIRVDPTRVLTVADFKALAGTDVSSDLATRFKSERKTLFGKSRGNIRVESAPAGGRILIDGAPVGETPLLAKSLLPGDHYIVVTKEGAGAFWKQVTVKSGTITVTATLNADAVGPLGDIARNLDRNVLDGKTRDKIKAVATTAGADYVVFGGIRPDGDTLVAKSYAMRTKDGALAELVGVSLDTSLLGAGIEIVKIANDLGNKIQTKDFAPPASSLTTVFEGVAAAKEAASALTEVIITPPTADSAKPPDANEGGVEGASSHSRGPVTADSGSTEEVKPAAKEEEKPKTGQSALQQLEERRKARERKNSRAVISDDAPKTDDTKADEPKADEEEKPSGDNGPAEKKDVDLNAHSRSDSGPAGLTAEQLAKLRDAEQQKTRPGTIAAWTVGSIVVAAALAVGAYFLFRPTAATDATATVHYTP